MLYVSWEDTVRGSCLPLLTHTKKEGAVVSYIDQEGTIRGSCLPLSAKVREEGAIVS